MESALWKMPRSFCSRKNLGFALDLEGNLGEGNSRCEEEFSWGCGFARFEVVVTRYFGRRDVGFGVWIDGGFGALGLYYLFA